MMNFIDLPSSKAEAIDGATIYNTDVTLTFNENIDEQVLYNNLSKRLIILETSLETNQASVNLIQEETNRFKLAFDEKEEILMRVDWLNRLYKVKAEIVAVEIKEAAIDLQRLLSAVQTCPMKQSLLTELDILVASLPSEETEPVVLSSEEIWMEKAIEEAGDAFINLGKSGRDFVISDVLKQSGKVATIKAVQESTIALEKRVEALASIDESEALIEQLDSLPIPLFHTLPAEKKTRIVTSLLENNKSHGLAPFERLINQLDKAITNEERKERTLVNKIDTVHGEATFTFDIGEETGLGYKVQK